MKRMNLKAKFTFLVLVPLMVVSMFGWKMASQASEDYEQSQLNAESAVLIDKISALIHQVQVERAKTSLFLGKGENEGLNVQREKVNRAVGDLNKANQLSAYISPQLGIRVSKIEEDIEAVRKEVDAKSPAIEMTRKITSLVSQMIKLQVELAYDTSIFHELNSALMLELGKESGGQFRAQLVNILSHNKVLSYQQVRDLQSLFGGFVINVNSPVLRLKEDTPEKLKQSLESLQWKEVQRVYGVILDKYNQGEFGEDPKQFFENMTFVLEGIGQAVSGEVLAEEKHAIDEMVDNKKWMWGTIIGLGVFMLLITTFTYLTLNSTTSSIQSTVRELNSSSDELNSAFEQLKSASQQISFGASASAASLEETVASLEEVSGMVRTNAESLVRASELAQTSKELAENGDVQVKHLIGSMEELAVYSAKIENFVSVIDEIAFQINLLALNAAVEAARAGEQGKGFAVVADAVRELAQKSAAAAKEVETLISISVEKTKAGVELANKNGAALSIILRAISDLAVIVNEITQAGQEQAIGLGQINQAVNQLDESTQANAASAAETSSSADALSSQSQKLRLLVGDLSYIVDGVAT